MQYLILFLSLILISCGSSTREAATADDSTSSSPKSSSANLTGLSFYRKYIGTIAGKNVTAHLKVAGEKLSGTYYYDEIGIPIKLWPSGYDEVADRHKAFELAGDQSQSWSVTIDENSVQGRWEGANREHIIDLKSSAGSDLFVWSRADSLRAVSDHAEPRALISSELLLLSGASTAFQNAIFSLKEGDRQAGKNPETIWQESRDSYFEDYRNLVKETPDSEIVNQYSMNHESVDYAEVFYDTDGMLAVGVLTYFYSGGAHGLSCTGYFNFDQRINKVLTLSDMMKVDSSALKKIIEASARNRFQIPTEVPLKDRLFVEEMYVSDHYFITHKGITFNYCPYELASYAEGEIQLFVPWQQLRKLLRPEFIRRMKL